MAKTILIATTNKGKLSEIYALLTGVKAILTSPGDISLSLEVEESGLTYSENARLKASAFCKASGLPALADDSGLEVELLDGMPGLHSARFSSNMNATDADRRALLLEKLKALPQPWKARFVCTMALAIPAGGIHFSSGVCTGKIIPIERGDFGFGYDPIFMCENTNQTMAELLMEEKNRISHRARAAAGMLPILLAYLRKT
jgi:XTP/dITP diphosphohydrolase